MYIYLYIWTLHIQYMYSVYGEISMYLCIYICGTWLTWLSPKGVISCWYLIDELINVGLIPATLGTGARLQLSDLGLEEKLVEAQGRCCKAAAETHFFSSLPWKIDEHGSFIYIYIYSSDGLPCYYQLLYEIKARKDSIFHCKVWN